MRKQLPLVSIIIANYNGERFLQTCLSWVLKTNYSNFEAILIDDGSIDKSVRIIKEFAQKDRRIKLFKNRKTLGAAASRNKGIKKSSGEIIVFLDNDTEVEQEWLKELVNVLQSSPKIGGACCKLLDFEKRDKIQLAGLKLIPHTGWGIGLGVDQRDEKWDKQAEVVAVSAALAVKRQVLDKIGGFDEKLAVHTEDLDFCWRVWLAGYKIIYVPTSRVYHWTKTLEQRKDMKATKSFIYFHINKNTLRTLIKNYEFFNMLKYLSWAFLINLGRAILVLIRRKDFTAIYGFLKGLGWNLVNLPDSLKERERIQRLRKVSDRYLYQKIMTHDSLWQIYRKHFSQTKLL